MYICGHCGEYHVDDETAEACRKAQRAEKRVTFIVVMSLIATIFAISLTISQFTYGDWRCAFMQCRKTVK